jgi:hypothetical protein
LSGSTTPSIKPLASCFADGFSAFQYCATKRPRSVDHSHAVMPYCSRVCSATPGSDFDNAELTSEVLSKRQAPSPAGPLAADASALFLSPQAAMPKASSETMASFVSEIVTGE